MILMFCGSVLGLAAINLTSPTAAHIALCSPHVAGTDLVSHHTHPPKSSRQRVGKRWGGAITRATDLNCPKGYSMLYDVTLSNKSWGSRRKGGSCYGNVCLPKQLLCVLRLCFPRLWLNIVCWWEEENNCFSFWFCVAFAFVSLNSTYIKPKLFFPPSHVLHLALLMRGRESS